MKALTLCTTMLLLSGCDLPFDAFRWQATEPQKQLGDVTVRLASQANTGGLPPGSEATRQLARAAATGAAYIGAPDKPTPIEDLIPPSITGAWQRKAEQIAALKLRENIQAKVVTATTDRMANLASTAASQPSVPSATVVSLAETLGTYLKWTQDVIDAIPVRADAEMTADQRERLASNKLVLDKIDDLAIVAANRRPTVTEVADKGFAWMEKWGLDETLYGLFGMFGLGGVGLAIKRGRAASKAVAKADSTERSAEAIIAGVDAIVEGAVGKATLADGQTVAGAIKTILGGQDKATRDLVDKAQKS